MDSLKFAALSAVDGGRHFASEPHIRIEVLDPATLRRAQSRQPFTQYHGELLIICLKGSLRVKTTTSALDLATHDQALLLDGEAFTIECLGGDDTCAEFIYAPGPTPCRVCWETDSKFFEDSADRK